jgi:DNA-binding response OmpR family regulator
VAESWRHGSAPGALGYTRGVAPKANALVALVEDERSLRETIGLALRRAGFRVALYADGLAAWEALARELPDLAILDIVLPRLDGLELLRRLRGRSERLPILMLTSRVEELDRVLGLELGADDYLTKPFSLRELEARVKVLLRRAALGAGDPAGEESWLEAGALRLDFKRFRAWAADRELPLTVTEFHMLAALARRPGHVKTRRQLVSEGYPHDNYVSERTIDSHVKRMRRKLAQALPGSDPIETVYGLGYRLREI